MRNGFKTLLGLVLSLASLAHADVQLVNQTATVSPVLQNSFTPFSFRIETENFSLPDGLQSYVWAVYEGKWLLMCGRINGLHGFNNDTNNFPPNQQNTNVYVVDPSTGTTYSRSLYDSSSGLSQRLIDSLSVTAAQSYRDNATLFIAGGYGVDTETGKFSTKDTFTAVNIPGLMHWVMNPSPGETASRYLMQISDPRFQVTGGFMDKAPNGPTLLVFGQNFKGYYADSSDGSYTEQIRRFRVKVKGGELIVKFLDSCPKNREPNFRRRDLNVVPAILHRKGHNRPGFIAFSGVFTTNEGIWTVPVEITRHGHPKMKNPNLDITFKQGMNNYQCSHIGLFSEKSQSMHTVLLGGISYGYFTNGTFETDSEIPFINQVTTVTRDRYGHYIQYLMEAAFPVIPSTFSNPGNELLFGAGSHFFVAEGVPRYSNDVINLDALGAAQTILGHVVGGIQSTLPNTNTSADSAASPYIFRVTIIPH